MNNQNSNDLKEIITRALEEMKFEAGDSFDLQKVNLAELGHRTNISRKKLRKIKEDGFIIKPHGLLGTKKQETVLSGFTGTIDAMLQQGISNTEKKVLTIDRKNCLPSSEKTAYRGQKKVLTADRKNSLPNDGKIILPRAIIPLLQRTQSAVQLTLTAHEPISHNPRLISCSKHRSESMVKPKGGAKAPH